MMKRPNWGTSENFSKQRGYQEDSSISPTLLPRKMVGFCEFMVRCRGSSSLRIFCTRHCFSAHANIPLPKPLYDRLTKCLEGSGYRSVTEYIIYVIRKNLPDLESDDVEKKS
jgi:hypothetical protein